MAKADWSPEAENDLEVISLHITIQDGRPLAAEKVVRGVHELCNLIATHPEMGEARPEFGVDCRVSLYRPRWVILYRPFTDGIEVLRVVDGSRDYDALFRT